MSNKPRDPRLKITPEVCLNLVQSEAISKMARRTERQVKIRNPLVQKKLNRPIILSKNELGSTAGKRTSKILLNRPSLLILLFLLSLSFSNIIRFFSRVDF